MADVKPTKCVVIGAGPVGALAALYAARRGWDVEVYELRGGMFDGLSVYCPGTDVPKTSATPQQRR